MEHGGAKNLEVAPLGTGGNPVSPTYSKQKGEVEK